MAKKKKADRRLTTPMKGKLILVFGGIIFLFLILVVKLCYVTATKGKEYETAVLSQQKHDSTILPFERGKIYDRNGNILATNEKIYTLILEPQNILLQDKKYEEATINALHEYFGFSKSKLKKTIEDNPYSYYEVYKKNMTYDEVEKFQKFLDLADASAKGVSKAKKAKIESAKMVKGVSFVEDYKRVYPFNSLACRVLGYTSSGNVGNWGIEQYYNSQLNGVNGRAYYYFNEELDQEQSVKEPKNGNSVVSTIDMQIQKIIEQKLKDYLNVDTIIWIKDGIDPDETNGHIDDVACFVRPGEVACIYTDDPTDPFYKEAQAAYHTLSNAVDAKGRKLIVHKLCTTKAPVYLKGMETVDAVPGSTPRKNGDLAIASYLNFLIVNGGIILPQYGDENDALAIRQVQSMFPERKVIGVRTEEIAYGGGNIHCITQQQPKA